MIIRLTKKELRASAAVATAAVTLVACSNSDPLAEDTASDSGAGDTKTITIGTANFPESEIIGQIWAQTLRDAGYTVSVKSGIGSREVYVAALAEGSVDIVPEYSGNLAQFYLDDQDALPVGSSQDDVVKALQRVVPEGLQVGDLAPAESKDSYRVTKKFAKEHGLNTLGDLKKLTAAGQRIRLAGNPELSQRPYGPQGLEQVYGVPAKDVELVAISDGGGPLTIASLLSGASDMADIYTTSPALDDKGEPVDVVELQDPKGMILPQNVVPLMRSSVPEDAQKALNAIDSKLTTDALKIMNTRNVGKDKTSAEVLGKDFATKNAD